MKNETDEKKVNVFNKLSTTAASYAPMLLFIFILVAIGFFINETFFNDSTSSITVTGVANSQKDNKLAIFTADITKKNDDKQMAVKELNESSLAVMEAIKAFGIDSKDIKTNYYNVYQNSEWDPIKQETKMTDWSATISVEVRLKDVSRAGDLGNLLASLDTTQMSGPNFSLDPNEARNNDLLKDAMEDAKAKAEDIAATSNRRLGKVIRVDENSFSDGVTPYLYAGGGKGGMEDAALSLDAGTSSVQKSVLVTFELK